MFTNRESQTSFETMTHLISHAKVANRQLVLVQEKKEKEKKTEKRDGVSSLTVPTQTR